MSLVSFIGPRPNILDLEGTSRRKRLEVRQPILTNERPREDPLASAMSRIASTPRRSTSPIRPSRARRHADGALDRLCDRAEAAVARRLQHHHPVRPAGRPRPHPDPGAARDGGGAPSPDPQGPAHLGRARRRVRRAARGASFLPASPATAPRRSTPISPSRRMLDMHERGELPDEVDGQGGGQALHQVDRQGHAQGDVQDGHLDLPVLLRRADLRRGRPVHRSSSTAYFFGTATTIEGVGLAEIAEETVRRHRDAFGDAPVYRTALDVGGEYAFRMRGENHVWTPDTVRDAAARRARQRCRTSTAPIAARINEQDERFADHPRPVPHQGRGGRRARAGAARGGRAGGRHRASASRPARCRSARSRARRTRRSPSP